MPEMETKLNILIDGLKKKEEALAEIVRITENQGSVIHSEMPLAEVEAFMLEMNEVKQGFIQQVLRCDALFESILKEVGPELDATQDSYQSHVAEMQKYIRRVMDLDVKVRVNEEENNQKLSQRKPQTANPRLGLAPAPMPPDSARVVRAYEQGKKNFKG